jgi:hypothetical protein
MDRLGRRETGAARHLNIPMSLAFVQAGHPADHLHRARAALVPALLLVLAAPPARAVEEPHALLTTITAVSPATPVAFDPSKIGQRGVAVQIAGETLRLATRSDHAEPGVTLSAPDGRWDWSNYEYVEADVKNTGSNRVKVSLRVANVNADDTQNHHLARLALEAGQSGVLRVELIRNGPPELKGKLFGMRGFPKGTGRSGATIDAAQVVSLEVFVAKPAENHTFEIRGFRTGGRHEPSAVPANLFPFIDTFGQYIHEDWPGKTHSLDELRQRAATEPQDWRAHPGPSDWDQWGGWAAGPRLEATGFFRTAKHEGKWWLVTPGGRLFWSSGPSCVRPGANTPIADRATWFRDFPGDQPDLMEFSETVTRVVHGHYKGRTPFAAYNFLNANLKRKYGDDWRTRFDEISHTRLRSWGLNTIANWSNPAIYLQRKTPYTATVDFRSKPIEGSSGYWGQFKDPFDPDFTAQLRAGLAAHAGKAAGDPWCIGFFVDNEISFGSDTSLAVAALQSSSTQAAKIAFLDDLKIRYGSIGKLNAAWATSHADWAAMAEHRDAPDQNNPAVIADLKAFYRRICTRYFKTVRDELKAAAPHQLYLGCRLALFNEVCATEAAAYCDVVSYNRYTRGAADMKPSGGADVPLIIGEFHFGALDRGMFHPGLVATRNQAERAAAYTAFVREALENPYLVGAHWFQFQDQPVTGRSLDEENFQVGLVDGCDTPYPELIAATRALGDRLYSIRRASP